MWQDRPDYRCGDGDLVPDEEFEVQATAGLGAGRAFDAARRFVLRAAMSLGDRQAVAVGLMIAGGRRGVPAGGRADPRAELPQSFGSA